MKHSVNYLSFTVSPWLYFFPQIWKESVWYFRIEIDVQMLGNKNASTFILDHYLNLPFDPFYQNTPKIVGLPICNILNMPFCVTAHKFNSIISNVFVRCVCSYDMLFLNSWLACTNVYYYYYVVLKAAALVLLFMTSSFIAVFIISTVAK